MFENQGIPNVPAKRPKPTSRFDQPTEPREPTKTFADSSSAIEEEQASLRDNQTKFIPPTRKPIPTSKGKNQAYPVASTKSRPRVNNRARGPMPPQSETNIAVTTELSRFQQYQVRNKQRQSGQVKGGLRNTIQTKTESQNGQDRENNEIQDPRSKITVRIRKP